MKPFELVYSPTASAQYDKLELAQSKQFKAVDKALDFLSTNPKHAGLNSHKFDSLKGKGPGGCDIWESAENNTPGAYRIFWHYGVGAGKITVVSIVPHPKQLPPTSSARDADDAAKKERPLALLTSRP